MTDSSSSPIAQNSAAIQELDRNGLLAYRSIAIIEREVALVEQNRLRQKMEEAAQKLSSAIQERDSALKECQKMKEECDEVRCIGGMQTGYYGKGSRTEFT